MTHTEARALASQCGTRMCDENGHTHGEELYCFDLDDIIALKEALAQPKQEPVAWFSPSGSLYKTRFHATANGEQAVTPLYAAPPQRKPWVGLTDEEQQQAYEQWQNDGWGVFYNAIEAKLKDKNQ